MTPAPAWFDRQRLLLTDLAAASSVSDGFGWLDETGRVDPGRPVEAWITCRMTHVLALAERYDDRPTGALVEHGLDALTGPLADAEHGGWFAAVGGAGPHGRTKRAYEHAFVLLAASSALVAGHERARPLLDGVLDVLESRFFDDAVGLYVDVLAADWSRTEDYLGANATMHLVEALLTAHDAGAGDWTLDRARDLAERIVHDLARGFEFRLPEHLDGSGEVVTSYHRDRPDDPFRPYGVTIGHQLEWARLLVHLHHAIAATGAAPPPWLVVDAESLAERAVGDGWAVDGAEGFVYTVDFDGRPVVRQRLHWVVAEAINAVHVLAEHTGDARYVARRDQWWQHARDRFVDVDGSWRHELAPDLTPASAIWPGRPDVYHAYQAVLLPRLGPVGSFAAPLAEPPS